MAADLLGRPLSVAGNPESTAQGAAPLALKAMGRAASLADAVAALPPRSRRVVPNAATHAHYAKLKPLFNGVPATLAPLYSQLTRFQREVIPLP